MAERASGFPEEKWLRVLCASAKSTSKREHPKTLGATVTSHRLRLALLFKPIQ